ncbi:TetR family transcriptional regulator [Campylobacterota bacterium]|nr:TetR family transcriptional regulator [Campylobacterota bacterium]
MVGKMRKPCEPSEKPADRLSQKRRGFINGAFNLFIKQGFAKTKMSEIAQIAGSSLSTVYKCFPTKEELFAAVIEEKTHDVYREFDEVSQRHASAPPEEFLEIFGMKVLELTLHESSILFMRLAISEGHKNDGRIGKLMFERGFSTPLDVLEKYIVSKQKLGVFRACEASLTAARFFWMIKEPYHYYQLIMGSKLLMDGEEKRAVVRGAVELFLRGVREDV